MKLRNFLLTISLLAVVSAKAQITNGGNIIADEGAWCWFADPRAMHYTSADGSINAAYIGYIDVHGAIKATQMDFVKNKREDVLVRSVFQPDDHDNPTFLTLPDKRIMLFYTRHTDESKFYYRISKKPGDITNLGEEKVLSVANNTTYPSPFILSDDPDHIYLCWRGIGWHPTIAKLSMPDANDNCNFEWGPCQIVQSTGARPYAKYQSNGKDKIYVSYTTGHPDNEKPNWLYFNVIEINAKKNSNGTYSSNPKLCDLKGIVLSTIANEKFNVNKTDSYKSSYPNTIIDAPDNNIRDWVWQITLDENENPVVAMVRISEDKNTHQYYYAHWNGSSWKLTFLANAGGRFHSSNTEYCYSGGMSIDPDNVGDIYLSIPTDGTHGKVYEIWKYTVNSSGIVTKKEQITKDSEKNNVRPFILPGSKDSPLRLGWMNGDYYYWIVDKEYPKGYPTSLRTNYQFPTDAATSTSAIVSADKSTNFTNKNTYKTLDVGGKAGVTAWTIITNWAIDANNYFGTLLSMGNLTYGLDASSEKPYAKVGSTTFASQNRLGTSDDHQYYSSGTDGKTYMTKLADFFSAFTYDGTTLTIYRNGWIDQKIEVAGLSLQDVKIGGFIGSFNACKVYAECLTQGAVRTAQGSMSLNLITLPTKTWSDLILPTKVGEYDITWASSYEPALSATGVVNQLKVSRADGREVTLTATVGNQKKYFKVRVMPRDLPKNLLYSKDNIDMTRNTTTGFSTNTTITAPSEMLDSLRSYTFLLKVNATAFGNNPRFYDFGSGSGNSLFLRAVPLSVGLKYNGGTTTLMNSATTLSTQQDYYLAVTYSADTKTTTLYIGGEVDMQGTSIAQEAYQLYQVAKDSRNYIGRTQWWDTSYASDNVDYQGTMDGFRLYNTCLTRQEICELQGLEYSQVQAPSELQNPDFEASYTKMSNSGVNSDRAIYLPSGWSIDYSNRNENDLTALKSGDLYYSNFFASKPAPSTGSKQTYWIRQNWGTSTITLHQTICLPAGKYRLTADVWKSGLGGDISVNVVGETGTLASSASLENKEAWQKVDFTFDTDGTNITVNLSAIHNSNGNEKIIGFDNISITPTEEDGFLLGDANCDGAVDISDVVLAVNHILGNGVVKSEANADINKDESIDISDIVGIVNIILNGKPQTTTYYWYVGTEQPTPLTNPATTTGWTQLTSTPNQLQIESQPSGGTWYVAIPHEYGFQAYDSTGSAPDTAAYTKTQITIGNVVYDLFTSNNQMLKVNAIFKP